MELDERKYKILCAVIQNYLETGEPVGSRTISKYTDLNLSSATIRNEMADLEELGYILQPHTSAGRIPSDKGYRLYVDHMMQERENELQDREREVIELKEFLNEKVEKVEELLQDTAKLLANNTNYTTMISAPKYKKTLKFIQLSQMEENKLLCVIVLHGNVIRNRVIHTNEPVDAENLLKMNILFNNTLNGLTLEEINLGMITKMTGQAGSQMSLVQNILEVIAQEMVEEDDMKVYTSGTTNIFKYPELSDSSKASELICTLEEKNLLTNLLTDRNGEENQGIQIYIGDETPVNSMKDCSVVTATYELQDGVTGTIGIIGPKRMDYKKVLENLNTVKEQLDIAFRKE